MTVRELRALLDDQPDDMTVLMTKDGNEYWTVDELGYTYFTDKDPDDIEKGLTIWSGDYEVDVYARDEEDDENVW